MRSTTVLALVVVCSSLIGLVHGAYCHGKPTASAHPNTQAITQPTPSFVRAVPNGALYEVQVDDQMIPIVHLWGTPYEKGFAHGQLMAERLPLFLNEVMGYIIDRAAKELNKTGIGWAAAVNISTTIVDDGLDVTSWMTGPYTGAYYEEELQGIADACGASVDQLRRIQMLGELTKGSCSMFGAWDQALGQDGLLTMRALDWITSGPFQNYHQLTVYHADPNNTLENSFINMGWTGWVGSISGVNEYQLSIHEIGVYFPDSSFGAESTFGVPFTYVLRDILQFDRTRMDSVSRLASAHRTCDLILGVGDGKDRRFNSIAYSASECGIMDDTNMKPVAPWHPTINGTIYYAMDWNCPGFNAVMAAQIEMLWGRMTPALAIQYIMPIVQTGNLHTYIADLVNQQWYVSFAANDNSTSPNRMAYDRQFAQLDLPSIFAVTQSSEDSLSSLV